MYDMEIEYLEKTLGALVFWEQRPQVAQIISSLLPEQHATHLLERILKLDVFRGQENPGAFVAHSKCRIGSRVVVYANTLRRGLFLKKSLPTLRNTLPISSFKTNTNSFAKKNTSGNIHRFTFFGRHLS